MGAARTATDSVSVVTSVDTLPSSPLVSCGFVSSSSFLFSGSKDVPFSDDRSTLIIAVTISCVAGLLALFLWRYSSVMRARLQRNSVDADKSPSLRLASLSSSSSTSLAAGLDSPQQICIPPISSRLMIGLDDPEVVIELSQLKKIQLDDPEVVIEWSS
jgi:hypothetical protein